MRATRVVVHVFEGGGGVKVFKTYMIIQCYAYMYFKNSQGGRS